MLSEAEETISKKMQAHYAGTLAQHGPSAKGVDWRDEQTATIRYRSMQNLFLPVADTQEITLLDVGCGYGAFLAYLKDIPLKVRYQGIDLVEEMLVTARTKFPEAIFFHADFLKEDFKKSFDYLTCNGILTQKFDVSLLDMEAYFKKLVKKMFELANIGCCFNLMSTRVNFFAPNLFYRHPSEILTYCLSEITNNVKLDHSYGLYEFTVYLYK